MRDRAHGVEIDPSINDGLVDHQLGRNAKRRAGQCRRLREAWNAFADQILGQTEIEHLDEVRDATAVAQHDVRRFGVAMDQPDGVGFGEGGAELHQDVDPARGDLPAVSTMACKVMPSMYSMA
jgi:hypothetical protein